MVGPLGVSLWSVSGSLWGIVQDLLCASLWRKRHIPVWKICCIAPTNTIFPTASLCGTHLDRTGQLFLPSFGSRPRILAIASRSTLRSLWVTISGHRDVPGITGYRCEVQFVFCLEKYIFVLELQDGEWLARCCHSKQGELRRYGDAIFWAIVLPREEFKTALEIQLLEKEDPHPPKHNEWAGRREC